jgi:hypothetical protein
MNFKHLLDYVPQAAVLFNDYPIAALVLLGLVLLGLGFLTAWWLRGAVDAGEIRRLHVETQVLKKRSTSYASNSAFVTDACSWPSREMRRSPTQWKRQEQTLSV